MRWPKREPAGSRPWAFWQVDRIDLEQDSLRKYFPDFSLLLPASSAAYACGTWGSQKQYTIEVHLGAAFPDAAPTVYIVRPFPLLGYGGKAMHDYKTSHEMHTFESDRLRATKLCVVHPEAWEARWSVAKVIQKAQLWLLAYEFHRETGQPVDDFLVS